MKKRLPFVPTAILVLLIVFGIPMLLLLVIPERYLYKENALSKVTSLFTLFCIYASSELAVEFAGRYGPKPFAGHITKFAHRVTQKRDRFVFAIGTILSLLTVFLPIQRIQSPKPWMGFLSLGIGFLIFYCFCFIAGTNELRAFLNIKPKNARTLLRPQFLHEKFPSLLVSQAGRDFSRLDDVVSELAQYGYQASDKCWLEGDTQEFSVYWMEREFDQLILQAGTHEGIKLFGPLDLLDDVRQFVIKG